MKNGASISESRPDSSPRTTTPVMRSPCVHAADRPMRVHHEQPTAELVRRHHLVQHRDRDPRVVAQPAHPAVAGIQRGSSAAPRP